MKEIFRPLSDDPDATLCADAGIDCPELWTSYDDQQLPMGTSTQVFDNMCLMLPSAEGGVIPDVYETQNCEDNYPFLCLIETHTAEQLGERKKSAPISNKREEIYSRRQPYYWRCPFWKISQKWFSIRMRSSDHKGLPTSRYAISTGHEHVRLRSEGKMGL